MKTTALLKTITVAGAVAATLTLSACDMHISFGQEGPGQEQSQGEEGPGQEQSQGEEGPGQEQSQGQDAETSANPDEEGQASADSGSPAAQEPAPGSGTDSSSSASDSNSSASSSNSSASSTTENDGDQGPRIGEQGVELDADGNGKIPADVLEEDITNAYAKQGTTVDTVDCFSDLRIYSHRGSQNCTVTALGKKHYGTVKITSASQSGISYSLEFPHF